MDTIISLKRKRITGGFTLIELMIVCAIISVIALILVPAFLRSREQSKKQQETVTEKENQSLKIEELPYRINPEGNLPVFSSEDIKINLSLESHRIGMDVYNRFEADYKGEFLIKADSTKDGPVRLDFKFPGGTTEARDVSLKFVTESGTEEPENVIYDRDGIFWVGTLPEKGNVKAEVSFIAQGRNSFEYYLPAAHRTKGIRIGLEIDGDQMYFIPDGALQPTSIKTDSILWEFKNLVTDRAITVNFPEAQSPLGRVIFMCKLVGLAVLFFGLGFWYLAALYQIEGLITFRWGHFMLLALTYSLFFVVFGVLGFRGDIETGTAIVISAALSLPLLTLHVSRIIDMKFAFFHNLPFSVFTLGLVINGVYGGPVRDYIFIGAAFIAVAFVTLTFRKWSLNREKWLNKIDQDLSEKIEGFVDIIKEGKELYKKSEEIINSSVRLDKEMVTELEHDRKSLLSCFRDYDNILLELCKLKNSKHSGESGYIRENIKNKLYLLEGLPNYISSIKVALESIFPAEESKNEKKEPLSVGKIHCLFCGHPGDQSPYCPNCGREREKIIDCRCGDSIKIPVHLIQMEKLAKKDIYCSKCGEKHLL